MRDPPIQMKNEILLNRISEYLDNRIVSYYVNRNEIVDYNSIPNEILDKERIFKIFSDYKKDDIEKCYHFIKETIFYNLNSYGIDYYRKNDSNYRKIKNTFK